MSRLSCPTGSCTKTSGLHTYCQSQPFRGVKFTPNFLLKMAASFLPHTNDLNKVLRQNVKWFKLVRHCARFVQLWRRFTHHRMRCMRLKSAPLWLLFVVVYVGCNITGFNRVAYDFHLVCAARSPLRRFDESLAQCRLRSLTVLGMPVVALSGTSAAHPGGAVVLDSES